MKVILKFAVCFFMHIMDAFSHWKNNNNKTHTKTLLLSITSHLHDDRNETWNFLNLNLKFLSYFVQFRPF